MISRTSGETLAMSDSVAMTPTSQPAAAGTHRKVEARCSLGVVSVISREDMPATMRC